MGLSRSYLPTLDGWRAIAILAVILNHDRVPTVGGYSLLTMHFYGARGVDLFFAISGILICTRLLDEEKFDGTINIKRFYIRRLFRIQPAALAYLATISLMMALQVLYGAPKSVLYSAFMVRNYFPLHSFPDDWYSGHFWSLAVEEHFYLLLPGFLVVFRQRRVAIMMFVLLVLEVWRIEVFNSAQLQFGNVGTRTDLVVSGILLSALAALLLRLPWVRSELERHMVPWAAISMAVVVWTWAHFQKRELTHFALECTYPLVIVSTMLHPKTITGWILELPVLRFIGRISYSIYLWQMLFFPLLGFSRPARWSVLAYVQNSWLRYVGVLAASLLSYYLIEKPMIKVGHRLAKSPIPGRGEFGIAAKVPGRARPLA